MAKRGRKSKILTINMDQMRALYISGFTDDQVADFFKIDQSTLNRWKSRHPEFRKSLKEWKEIADAVITESLYHRAKGYSHNAVKFFQAGKKIIKANYIEHYPPDATSMIFWLKNRQPETWRDKHEWEGKQTSEIKKTVIIKYEQLAARDLTDILLGRN